MKILTNIFKSRGAVLTFLWLSGAIREYRKNFSEFTSLKRAMMYLKTVEKVRHVLVIVFQVLISIVIFITGFVVSHCALFYLIIEGFTPRATVLLVLGVIEFGASISFVLWFLSPKRWLRNAVKENPTLEKVVFANGKKLH